MAIQWAQEAWKEATGKTIKSCFEKCGLVKSNDDLMEVGGDDLEFERLVRELSPDMSAAEYAYFNVDIPTSEPMINEHEVDWKERLQEDCINAITTQSNVSEETQEILDDDMLKRRIIFKKKESVLLNLSHCLTKKKKCYFLEGESQMMLSFF